MASTLRKFASKVTPEIVKSVYRSVAGVKPNAAVYRSEEDRLEAMVGPRGVWQESRDFQIDFLRRNDLQPAHSVLDIGCGVLRGGIPLIRYLDVGGYTGFDIRPSVIEEAWLQVEKEGLESKSPIVLVSDTFGRDELGDSKFDYIWCFQVFYHLEDKLVEQCLAQIEARLAAGGRCYANVNCTFDDGSWFEFPYLRRSLDFYENLASQFGLTMTDLGQQREWGYTDKVPGQFDHILEFKRATN